MQYSDAVSNMVRRKI